MTDVAASRFTGAESLSGILDERARRDVRIPTVSRGRQVRNRVATSSLWLCMLIAVAPLVAVILVLLTKGGPVINWHFLTSDVPQLTNRTAADLSRIPPSLRAKYHLGAQAPPAIGPAIVGTLISTAMAALLAIPLGVLGAIYLNEYGKRKLLARTVRFFADVMIGVPSIIMGLFIYTVWVTRYAHSGYSAFAAALALACLMLPIVIRSAEEMLRLVPDELRQSSLALGGRPWQTVLRVVLPAALPGITSGSMLAIARAAGETAPVLFTIGLGITSLNASLNGYNTTLAAQIFTNAKVANSTANQMAWGAALTLVVLVFVLTFGARLISDRFSTAAAVR
jgi:phosphate transport system permease protein